MMVIDSGISCCLDISTLFCFSFFFFVLGVWKHYYYHEILPEQTKYGLHSICIYNMVLFSCCYLEISNSCRSPFMGKVSSFIFLVFVPVLVKTMGRKVFKGRD